MNKKSIITFSYFYFIIVVFIPSILVILLGGGIKGVGMEETFFLLGLIIFPSFYFFNTYKKVKRVHSGLEAKFSAWNMICLFLTLFIAFALTFMGLKLHLVTAQEYFARPANGAIHGSGLFLNFLFAFTLFSGGLAMLIYGFLSKSYISKGPNAISNPF